MIHALEAFLPMTRSRMPLLLAAAAVLFATAAQAQAPTNDSSRVVLENEQVRVIEMRFKPGAKFDVPGHPNRFIYGVSDGALLFTPPGRTPYELSFRSGEALWLPAENMSPRNEGDKEVRALIVELKDIRAKSRRGPAAAKATPRPKRQR